MNITDICNLALSHIGRETIASIDEDTEAARTCKLHYDLQRKTLLRAYTWSFAKKYVKLALLNVKTPGWKYTYGYPNDCVMARKIYNEDNTWCILWKNFPGNIDQVMINDSTKALVCNHEEAYLEYTYDVKDANLFTADFTRALSYMLAADICVPLTGSAALAQQMANEGVGILQEAKYTMMGERNRAPEYPCKYFRARW